MYDLHFGLNRLDYLAYERDGSAARAHWGTDEDGWNAWGEAVGTDANDATTWHVIRQFATLEVAMHRAVTMFEHREAISLVPSTAMRHYGTLLVVTPHDDWSTALLAIQGESGFVPDRD